MFSNEPKTNNVSEKRFYIGKVSRVLFPGVIVNADVVSYYLIDLVIFIIIMLLIYRDL